jgi:hypothetical protein
MRNTARIAAVALVSAIGAAGFSGVASASELHAVPASHHHHDDNDHHVGLLGGVAEGVGGLVHGVTRTVHLGPLLHGLL